MPDETLDEDTIAARALEPLKAVGDNGNSMENRPISELIEADRYTKSQSAARRGLGIRRVKMIPGGAND